MQYEKFDKEQLIKILYEKEKYINHLKKKNKQLKYYATMDSMTSVVNRAEGIKLLNRKMKIAQITKEKLIVGFIDVDELKQVNDKFGHEEGDKLLINICKIIKKNIRKGDIIFRIGGDEFIIIFPKATTENVQTIWNKICKKIHEVNEAKIHKYHLGLSCGFVEYSCLENNVSPNDLIRRADKQMYENKDRYRNLSL